MDNTEKYEADFFGQKFILSTTDGERNDLEKVVNYYKKTLDSLIEKLPNRPQLDLAILAGLKITDKLYSISKLKNLNFDENEEKIHEIVNDAIKRLEISLNL